MITGLNEMTEGNVRRGIAKVLLCGVMFCNKTLTINDDSLEKLNFHQNCEYSCKFINENLWIDDISERIWHFYLVTIVRFKKISIFSDINKSYITSFRRIFRILRNANISNILFEIIINKTIIECKRILNTKTKRI